MKNFLTYKYNKTLKNQRDIAHSIENGLLLSVTKQVSKVSVIFITSFHFYYLLKQETKKERHQS